MNKANNMRKMNKYIILSCIALIVLTISGFTNNGYFAKQNKPVNLKVLPKNISDEELTKVMQGFNAALGVKCNHCHSPKDNGEKGLNFVSDANPNKDIARSMMKMTKKINKKYFNEPHEGVIQNINCNTCHNGNAEPNTVSLK